MDPKQDESRPGIRPIYYGLAVVVGVVLFFYAPQLSALLDIRAIRFSDQNLEWAIRNELGSPSGSIRLLKARELAVLNAASNGIVNLDGIEELTGLRVLDLSDNEITDITPLLENKGLGEHDIVHLEGNRLSENVIWRDIPKLCERGVEVTWLDSMQEPGIRFVPDPAILYSGEELDLPDGDFIRALRRKISKPNRPLTTGDFACITSLVFSPDSYRENQDLSGLEYCINLKSLDVGLGPLTSIPQLGSMSRLTSLLIIQNEIKDISGLQELESIEKLTLSSNNIEDISALGGLSTLVDLDLSFNTVRDIAPLYNLPNLEWLKLQGNQITDVSQIANMTNLTILDLRDNKIETLQPFIDNPAFGGPGNVIINLSGNPLNENAVNVQIPILEARGVEIAFYSKDAA